MKNFLITIILFSVVSQMKSQCSPPGADRCADAEILCSAQERDGLSCQTVGYSSPTCCKPLCSGGCVSINTSWWSFAGYKGQICITVTTTSCVNNKGIQFGVYEDECCYRNVACELNCQTTGSKTICFENDYCRILYFFVNGCDGDICDFSLSVTGGNMPAVDPPKSIIGPSDVCLGSENILYTSDLQLHDCNQCAAYLDGQLISSLECRTYLDFPTEGTFNLCFSHLLVIGTKICNESSLFSKQIRVTRNSTAKGVHTKVCEALFPFLWGNTLITGTGTYTAEFKIGSCIQDSIKSFIEIPSSIPPCKKDIYASGRVYYDINNNGSFDNKVDLSADGVFIDNDQSSAITLSMDGKYNIELIPNALNVIKAYAFAGTKNILKPKTYSIFPSVNSGQQPGNYDFALEIQDSIDLEVVLNLGRARAGRLVQATIDVNNLGALNVQNALLSLEFPSDWKIQSAVPTGKIGSSNMEWNFNASSIGTGLKFNVYFSLPGDIPAGKKFYLKARVSTPLDRNPVNNEMIFADIIRNSFDPNDKMVQIIRDPNSESLIGDLLYTIRFQNTGNDTAYDIIIRDSISHLLDPKTLRIVNNSHPCVYTMDALNLAQFHFKNILLPDSTTNYTGSQGFVQFLIKPKASVKANEMIYNRAGIYFDQNPPIITNVAATSFLTFSDYIAENIFIEIIPNPVKDKMLIKHNVPQSASTISAKIFSMEGVVIEQFVLDPSGSTLINPRLPSGIYYIVFERDHIILSCKKLISLQ
ncbi:MAG: T9SS type A sorting domain-containing protein [Saprospiraceae bacterium]